MASRSRGRVWGLVAVSLARSQSAAVPPGRASGGRWCAPAGGIKATPLQPLRPAQYDLRETQMTAAKARLYVRSPHKQAGLSSAQSGSERQGTIFFRTVVFFVYPERHNTERSALKTSTESSYVPSCSGWASAGKDKSSRFYSFNFCDRQWGSCCVFYSPFPTWPYL